MLKKLRIKFIAVTILITTIMLGCILGMLYYFTGKNLERESIQMMRNMAMNPRIMNLPENQMPDTTENSVRFPYFTVLVDRTGKVLDMVGGFYDLSDQEEIDQLVQMVEDKQDEVGVLHGYDFRFLRFETPVGHTIVFADMGSERFILRNLIRSLALVGVSAWLLLLGLSYFLAHWIVKPVETAWKQQKQFIADASHELKTPLTVIMTDAELLQESRCSEQEKNQLYESIHTMSEQMRGLVESMLELARIDNGMVKRDKEEILFSELTENVAMTFEPLLFEKDLMFTYEIEPDVMIQGNKDQLRQLVGILLENAGKYASSCGNVILKVKKTQRNHCLLTVSNQGDPISDEDIKHLFERFYRVDKARTRNHSYGLGLSIAQGIVQEHHGKIRVESQNGYNTFHIEL